MKNKNVIYIIIVIILILIVGILGYLYFNEKSKNEDVDKKENNVSEKNEFMDVVDQGTIEDEVIDYKYEYISNYDTYLKFIEMYNIESKLTNQDFEQNSYLIVPIMMDECSEEIRGIISNEVKDKVMTIVLGVDQKCGLCVPVYKIFLIPVDKADINNNYIIEFDYRYLNFEGCELDIKKPIIYLYPEKEIEVIVKLGSPDNLTTTYPKYNNEWHVLAYPNGDLIDLNTNRILYGLYWEGKSTSSKGIQKEGFVVKGEDSVQFLEEKLALLGLTEREANEFIIYWLPQLEQNKYNYIRFETIDEINANMSLEIYPKPETTIRILMEFKGLDSPIDVEEQQLKTPTRKGFTVVEWGGTKLN